MVELTSEPFVMTKMAIGLVKMSADHATNRPFNQKYKITNNNHNNKILITKYQIQNDRMLGVRCNDVIEKLYLRYSNIDAGFVAPHNLHFPFEIFSKYFFLSVWARK